jgi:hypothetical protein
VSRGNSRFRPIHPIMNDKGDLYLKANHSPLVKINRQNNLIWVLSDQDYHHSIEKDYEGNFWVCVSYYPFKLDKKYVDGKYSDFIDDGIRCYDSDGKILLDKSVSQILIENNLGHYVFSMTDKFKVDPIHLNDIQPANYASNFWKKGDLFLSLRNLSMIMLYRPSTNEIVWMSKGGEFYNQHDVDIIDDNRIAIFDNNMKFAKTKMLDGYNRVVVYNFKTDEYSLYLNDSIQGENVKSMTEGRSEILPNGDLFVESTNEGRLLYFDKNGDIKWSYNGSSTLGWSRLLYKKDDLDIVQKFLKKEN